MADMNRVCRLESRPFGMVKRDDFAIADEPIAEPGPGEFRLKVSHLSIDPAMRGWLAEGRSYVPAIQVGEVMRALGIGTVEASNNDRYAVGDTVVCRPGVQDYAISDGSDAYKVDPNQAPPERWIGGLGMPGITAYCGLLEIGKPQEGETVVVSAASGAVGSVVGQIAKLKGCRVVGIAGGPEKCAYVVDELGFDACVDYKGGNLAADLKAACPKRIDVFFENVGGEIFDTALGMMNTFGRIPVCGMISMYNDTALSPGPTNIRSILVNRLTVRGFIVFDFIDQYGSAMKQLGAWHAEGKLKLREDVRGGGINAFPDVLNLLYTGGNNGKLVLEL